MYESVLSPCITEVLSPCGAEVFEPRGTRVDTYIEGLPIYIEGLPTYMYIQKLRRNQWPVLEEAAKTQSNQSRLNIVDNINEYIRGAPHMATGYTKVDLPRGDEGTVLTFCQIDDPYTDTDILSFR